MITLTDIRTGNPVQVLISEISAVKEGVSHINGEALSCTTVFIVSESGYRDFVLEVKESPKEIGTLMIEELTSAGEEIRR